MPRKKKSEIKVNNETSLESLMQETYNDACWQILDSQKAMNEMVNSIKVETVDDATKIAKGKSDLLKIKDSSIKIKLEIAKLQNEIIKNNRSPLESDLTKNTTLASADDFNDIRQMILKNANKGSDLDD